MVPVLLLPVERFDRVLVRPEIGQRLIVARYSQVAASPRILRVRHQAAAFTSLRIVDNVVVPRKQQIGFLEALRLDTRAHAVSKRLLCIRELGRTGPGAALLDTQEQGVVHDVEIAEE